MADWAATLASSFAMLVMDWNEKYVKIAKLTKIPSTLNTYWIHITFSFVPKCFFIT